MRMFMIGTLTQLKSIIPLMNSGDECGCVDFHADVIEVANILNLGYVDALCLVAR